METALDRIARTRAYREGRLTREGFLIEDVSDYLAVAGTTVWIDLCAADAEDLKIVASELDLHELAVEDALETRQQPKLSTYDDHQLISMYAVRLDRAVPQIDLSVVNVFITPVALVTVRDESFDIDGVVRRWDTSPEMADHGVGHLLYGLMDYVVDGHFDAVAGIDEELDNLEDQLFETTSPGVDVQRRSFALRKSLVTLRRVVLPMREVVDPLRRRDLGVVDDALAPYFQSVYDHVLRVTESTESLRDMVSTILEMNLTLQANRLNVITKKVTSWAAIIAVPTAITGFYGQNLPYPGFSETSGFIASSALITVLSGGLYIAFRRRDWL